MSGAATLTRDGFVLRPLGPSDLDVHLAAIDDEQIRWLWEPGDGDRWYAMTPQVQRERQRKYLEATYNEFGPGPKWAFAMDAPDAAYVVYIDCDLAIPDAPPGSANISYSCHPAHRRKGYTVRAIGLVCEFLRQETAATEANLAVELDNAPSLGVVRAVGASEVSRYVDQHGRTMIRHVLPLRR